MPGSALHEHPDAGREGLRRVLVDGTPVLVVARAGGLYPVEGSLAKLLGTGRDRLHQAVDRALQRPHVPEPELALVIDTRGEIVGYLAADDLSSRSIEGANPLYLPQAKIYDDSLGLSGTIVLARDGLDPRSAAIELEIHRDGERVFAGETSVSEMKRGFDELVAALYLELSFPAGAVLLTGTGVVPPDEFTLHDGDRVRIAVEGVGVLEHDIYRSSG